MLLGGGRHSEVRHIGNDMGKCLGLKVSDLYWEVAAVRESTVFVNPVIKKKPSSASF